MSPFLAEFIGTAILTLFGCGVVANVVLSKTKGGNSGWIVITWGWAMGVFIAVYSMGQFSGAHINPAVSLGLAMAGMFEWASVPAYMGCQLAGAFTGAALTWLVYKDQFAATADQPLKLAVFSTAPESRNYPSNLITESIATFVLVFGVFFLVAPGFFDPADGAFMKEVVIAGDTVGFGLGSLAALPVALLVFGIGLSLGGPTGYAINPARDLGPRLAHAVLPIPQKGSNDWGYAWVPVIGPLLGAVLAAVAYWLVM